MPTFGEPFVLIRFSLLSSGSKGNCLFISSPDAKIIVDSGLSVRELQRRLSTLGEDLDGLKAIFVTHEHHDHVSGVGVLARRLGVPIYMTEGTRRSLPKTVGKIADIREFESGDSIEVDGLTLNSFSISHDAADPVSYTVRSDNAQLGIATDLGHAPNLVKTRLAGSNALILESNHCPDMLRTGPYPEFLQQRIRSRHGHLSNADMSSLLSGLLHDGLEIVVLCHISEENNDRKTAHDFAQRVLKKHKAKVLVASQTKPTRMIEIGS